MLVRSASHGRRNAQAHTASAVNLNAFDNRFFSTCCKALESVTMLRPRFGSTSMSNDNCRFSASWRNGAPRCREGWM